MKRRKMDVNRLLHKFSKKKNFIPGIFGNFSFFAHGVECKGNRNNNDEDIPNNDLDEFECNMVAELSNHLQLNLLRVQDIQIMSNNKARVVQLIARFNLDKTKVFSTIRVLNTGDKLPASQRGVTILILVGTGALNEEVSFIKSISKAIKRSRYGVIVIGSFRIIAETKNPKWRSIVNTMHQLGYLNPFLQLYCDLHSQIYPEITTPEDLRGASPYGGCVTICRVRSCGHKCGFVCHPFSPDHRSEKLRCLEPCQTQCGQGHQCILKCYEEPCQCESGCEFLRECGHPFIDKQECIKSCLGVLECGHGCWKPCKQCDRNHEGMKCYTPCTKECEFGHPCTKHPCCEGCPPCKTTVEFVLICGHKITQQCSEPVPDENDYQCRQPCRRFKGSVLMCPHSCTKMCFEDCGTCEATYNIPHPDCGHPITVLCTMRMMPVTELCQQLVPSEQPSSCGHDVLVPCHQSLQLSSTEVALYCVDNCILRSNECGHLCIGSCIECHQGRFHVRCDMACDKQLFCSHACKVPCAAVCQPCIEKCMTACEHFECPFECGVPCDYICPEPCPYSCEHLQCTQICGEICNRPGCMEPCPKLLSCGHPCVGYCGEVCPEGCRLCTPDILIDFLDEDDPSNADETKCYVQIPPCGHIVEESNMIQWLEIESEEIQLKSCPVCRKPILPSLRRYSALIQESWRLIQDIKLRICGDQKEMIQRLKVVRKATKRKLKPSNSLPKFHKFGHLILDECNKPMKTSNKSGFKFDSMYLDRVKFIEWVYAEWDKAEGLISSYEHFWRPEYFEQFMPLYSDTFRLIMGREWPLHPNEIAAITLELLRIHDLQQLYRRVSFEMDERLVALGMTIEGTKRFKEAEDILFNGQAYTQKMQAEFEKKFTTFCTIQHVTIQLSDKERREIVQAFGARAGRWFKCRNGHVFVVTECGGPTQFGTCNECGAVIGGEDHQLAPENQLATEMDGAEVSIWPTTLNREQ